MTLPAIAKSLAEQFMKQLAKRKKPLPKTDKDIWTQFYQYYQAHRKQYSEEQARALLWAFNVKGLLPTRDPQPQPPSDFWTLHQCTIRQNRRVPPVTTTGLR